MKTMNSTEKFMAESDTESNSKVHEDNDDDRHYCHSLSDFKGIAFQIFEGVPSIKYSKLLQAAAGYCFP